MKIPVGTKSLLFGVHNFLWHPWTVWLAWYGVHGVWPKWHEVVAIFCHDVGYWGSPDMDGRDGRNHPVRGADLTFKAVCYLRLAWLNLMCRHWHPWDRHDNAFQIAELARKLALGHSRFYAKQAGIPVSKLFYADKASIYFDPRWFYLLRARLSGEITEYIANSSTPDATAEEWFDSYRKVVATLL